MVKELIMDNLYNTNTLPSKIKGGDKFAFVTENDFQNIFSNKKDIEYADAYSKNDLYNVSRDNIIKNPRDFQSAGNRLDNKVSKNISTPKSPKEDKAPISVDEKVSNDGYSFSIRDSLQEKDSLSDEKNIKEDIVVEDTVKTEIKDGVESDVQSKENAEEATSEVSLEEDDIPDSEFESVKDDKKTEIEAETDAETEIEVESENKTEVKVDKSISNSATIESQILTELNLNKFIGSETAVNINSAIENESVDKELNISGENVSSSVTEVLSSIENSQVAEINLDGVSGSTETIEDSNVRTNDKNTDGIDLEDGNWEVLDESQQYEIDVESFGKTEVETTGSDINLSQDVAEEVLSKEVIKKTEEEIITEKVKEDVLISAEGGEAESVLNQKDVDAVDETIEANSKENGLQVTIKSNSIEIADNVSEALDEANSKLETDVSVEEIEDTEKTEVNTKVAEVVEDEISDADIEIKSNEKASNEVNIVEESTEPVENEEFSNLNGEKENNSQNAKQESSNQNEKLESDIDVNLDERTKLAYVDMTKTEDVELDTLGILESKISMYGEKQEVVSDEVVVDINDIVDNVDIDTEIPSEKAIKPTSMDELVDEEMLDELNITLKNSSSSVKDVYTSSNTTAEQLIRYAIEGENNFDTRLSATLRPTVQTQGEVSNSSSKEILAQITEKLTSFNFKSGSKLTIQLSPESMGTVEIKLTHTPDGIKAEMSAASDDARDMLNKNLDDLRDTLQKYGVRLDKVGTTNIATQQSTAHQDYTEQGNSQRQQQGQRQQNEKSTKEMERFEDMVSSLTEEEKE